MPSVIFEFPDGSSASTEMYDQLNILAHAQIVERSLQSRCGGHCECGTCRIQVVSGKVTGIKEGEQKLLKRARLLPENVPEQENSASQLRLACQCFPEPGEDVVIRVPAKAARDLRQG